MFWDLLFWGTDEHATRHPQMHNPLPRYLPSAGRLWRKIKHNMLAHTAHSGDAGRGKRRCNLLRRRFQRLAVLTQPHRIDDIAANTLVETARNGFDLGKLGHRESVKDNRVIGSSGEVKAKTTPPRITRTPRARI